MTDTQEALPRETGEEKTTTECGTCGTQLPVVVSPYGSRTTGLCPKCWGAAAGTPDQQAAQQAAADQADVPHEETQGG